MKEEKLGQKNFENDYDENKYYYEEAHEDLFKPIYNYYPNSFNQLLIKEKFGNMESFVNVQVAYRKKFEEFLKKQIEFDKIKTFITEQEIEIPEADDFNYNFYHKYSTLESRYLFLRNNFHVENLTDSEIIALSDDIDDNYFLNTLNRVIFEEGDTTFYGIPKEDNLVTSKSIVFEFSYDKTKCKDFEHMMKIEDIILKVTNMIKERAKELVMPVSFITYDCIPDIYKKDNELNE